MPVTDCQSDHLRPWGDRGGGGGGCTYPRNAGPACGRNNRLKEHGYTVWRDDTGAWHVLRDDTGAWHVLRPDGTEIP